MARLVAVDVLPDEPRDVENVALHLLGLLKEPVEPLHERIAPAHRLDESVGVLHHVPCVLEGVALGEVALLAVADRVWVERLAPLALRVLAAREANGGVEQVSPSARALEEKRGVLGAAKLLGHLPGAPVVIAALHRARDRFALDYVERIVAVLVENVPVLLAASFVLLRQRLLYLRVDALPVAGEALEVCVDENWHRVRADHALVVAAPERPYREIPRELALALHRTHEPRNDLRDENRVERMRRAERVPRGKRGVVRRLAGVGDVVRLDEEMVEGSVEVALLVVAPLDRHAGEHLLPLRVRGRCDAVEVPAGDLGGEIALGVGNAAKRRERDLYQERLTLRRAEVEDEIPLRRERTGELHLEGVGALDPVVDDDLAGDAVLAVWRDIGEADARGGGVATRYAPAGVDEKAVARALRIGDAVDGAAFGRGDLDLDAAGKRDGIEAGPRAFACLVVGHRLGSERRREGKNPHVAEIGTAGAVEVGLRKPEDRAVPITVARAVIPVAVASVGTCLNEPEGNAGRGKCMARTGRADERVHEHARI